jgi:hypothetical protein
MSEILGNMITTGIVLITLEKISEILVIFINMTSRFFKTGGLT